MSNFRLCLIEDDQAFLYLAKIIIQSVDNTIETISFPDGKPAFEFFEQNKKNASLLPDLILLDLNMPQMDGWGFLDAYDKIKVEIGKIIPIYILSSSIAEKDISRAKSNPLIVDFLSKPLEESKFADILRTLKK